MKKVQLILFLSCLCFAGVAQNATKNGAKAKENVQTLTVKNETAVRVFFQVFATDANDCKEQYTSVTASIDPRSTLEYQSPGHIDWVGKIKTQSLHFVSVKGMYMDDAGGCIADASDHVGMAGCNFKKEAVINTGKCAGVGNLKISWAAANDHISVNIK